MLYPIELLGHKSVGATDGVHVNGRALFCHVVRGLFKCRQAPCKGAGRFTVQFASPQKATIAKCNAAHPKNPVKCLFLKDLTAVRLLARRLLYRFLYKNNRRLVS